MDSRPFGQISSRIFAPSRPSREIFDVDWDTTTAVQIWKVTLKSHLKHALSAAASVAFGAQRTAMFAGTIGINDIKEQLRTLHEHCVNVKMDGGLFGGWCAFHGIIQNSCRHLLTVAVR